MDNESIITRPCGRCGKPWRCFPSDPFLTCEPCRVPVRYIPVAEGDESGLVQWDVAEEVKVNGAVKCRKRK